MSFPSSGDGFDSRSPLQFYCMGIPVFTFSLVLLQLFFDLKVVINMLDSKKFKTKRIISLTEKNRITIGKDLEKYQKLALDFGASDSIAIPSKWVKFDERVRMKCRVPRCHLYGSSPNCPPYTPDIDTMKRTMKKYKRAIFVKYDVPAIEDFVDQKKWLKGHEKHQRKIQQVCKCQICR